MKIALDFVGVFLLDGSNLSITFAAEDLNETFLVRPYDFRWK